MPPRPRSSSSTASGIRGQYETLGVQAFYETHGHEYTNPHNDQVAAAIAALMSSQPFEQQPGSPIRVLDLACGSGEATLALHAWAGAQQQGAQQQAQQPQQQRAPQQRRQRGRPAGSAAQSQQLEITACDPYTHAAYQRQTGCTAHHWSFQDIADGCLAGRAYDLCICSFALHLCDPSCLFITLYQLACRCRWLAVVAPHKQPTVREEHGWQAAQAFRVERVHVRLYSSLRWGQQELE